MIFSLDGLGLLGFEAVVKRDYPLMFGTYFSRCWAFLWGSSATSCIISLILGLISRPGTSSHDRHSGHPATTEQA